MKDPLLTSLLIAISYADIFDYPLTQSEIYSWKTGIYVSTQKQIDRGLAMLVKKKYVEKVAVSKGNAFFVLRGRKELAQVRFTREKVAQTKFEIIYAISRFLTIVPTISLVGVTGGLSMRNADDHDDIDICIICQKNTIWITRLLASLVVDLVGKRRRATQKEAPNSICLNMFMTQSQLRVMRTDQDLYSAHEVLQLFPLWHRSGMWQKFLVANLWVKRYLPTAFQEKMDLSTRFSSRNHTSFMGVHFFWRIVNVATKYPQLWYMQKHRTSEYISDSVIRFHPVDARGWVRRALKKRLRRFDVPLDKVFYQS
jgi:hypothetical protein